MRKSEVAALISYARGLDDRIEEVREPYRDPETREWVEDARVVAWHDVLEEIDPQLARQGLRELYRSTQMLRLQPGHVYEAAEVVRRRNVASVNTAELVTPEDGLIDEDGCSLMPKWRQAAIEAVGRGASLQQAQDYADQALQVTRRQLGPSARRLALAERPRGMGTPGAQMGESA